MCQTTVLQLEMFIFWFRATRELTLMSYSSKYTLESLSDKQFCVLTWMTWKLQGVYRHSAHWTAALLLEAFLLWLKLHERFDWRATASDMWCSRPLIQHCLCTASKSRKIWSTCNSITLQLTQLLPKMILFVLIGAKQRQPASYGPVHTLLYCDLVFLHAYTKNLPLAVHLCTNYSNILMGQVTLYV